jgi:hypothetical protein
MRMRRDASYAHAARVLELAPEKMKFDPMERCNSPLNRCQSDGFAPLEPFTVRNSIATSRGA